MPNKTKKVVLNVPEELHKQIKADAALEGITMHDYWIKIMNEHAFTQKKGG